MNRIEISTKDFDLTEVQNWLKQGDTPCGATVTFTGLVRDLEEGGLDGLYLEHYPGMTQNALDNIIQQARQRWSLGPVCIHHRIGWLAPGDNIVLVALASPHRVEAFEAAEFLMDYLKRDAPFWKKERINGEEHWVEQKESDRQAAKRWQTED